MVKQSQTNTVALVKKGVIAFSIIGLLIVFFVFNKLNNSEAGKVAEEYIKSSEEIKASLGEIESFGWASIGKVEESQKAGYADLSFELKGTKKHGIIRIYLIKNDSGWQVNTYELK